MDFVSILLGVLIGIVIGAVLGMFLRRKQNSRMLQTIEEIYKLNEEKSLLQQQRILEQAKSEFKDLSSSALKSSNEEFLILAETRLKTERENTTKELTNKKELIDQQLEKIAQELAKVGNQVRSFEDDRTKKFGELTAGIRLINEQATNLLTTTNSLKEALSSNKTRGQWGERMAEDVLKLAGFIENVNYLHDKKLGDDNTRPDYQFFMPNNLSVNMDVKFPWNNYVKYIESEQEKDREEYKKNFFKDVRNRIKEVTTKNYINPENKTIDYVLLFIPNESIYSFIHANDRFILDEALEKKVVLCSPITLFAVLSIIRKAVENFALERTSNEILSLFGAFKKQWDLYTTKTEDLGRKIQSVVREYDALTTTRKRVLEKPLNRIEEIRIEKSLPVNTELNLIENNENGSEAT